MNIDLITSLLAVTIRAGTSLLYATLGEILTERSGVLNLGLEGMLLLSAVSGFAAAFHSHSVLVGLTAAIVMGGLLGLLHAFLTITLRSNQTVTGLALTIFASGMASFLGQRLGPQGMPLVGQIGPRFERLALPVLARLPFVGRTFFQQDALVYASYLLVPAAWLLLYRTRPGLYLRAVGENPRTADAMGIHVTRTRYLYTILGGMLVGLGGAHLSLAYTPGWTENLSGGRGWIAVAMVIFATWDPLRAWFGAILFGGINAVQLRMQAAGTTIPSAFLHMLPFVFTIVILVVITWWEAFGKRVGAPAALGTAYLREDKD
jgi:simple sugar transport system permease protein